MGRIEENSVDTAIRKFADTVAKYNATQVEYDKNVKARVKGVLKTVLDKTDAELDEVVESGQSIEALRGVSMRVKFLRIMKSYYLIVFYYVFGCGKEAI